MNHKFLRAGLLLLVFPLLFLLLHSCTGKLIEEAFEGRFFIDNKTAVSIQVQVKDGSDFLVLQNSQIAAAATEQIYTVQDDNVGNILASNYFSEFKVFVRIGVKDSFIYQGVRNNDWEERVTTSDYSELYIEIR